MQTWRRLALPQCKLTRWDGETRELWVLAMPFGVVDSYNTFFSERTDLQHDKLPHLTQTPVYDYHGIGQDIEEKQPIGKVLEWQKDDAGWWARVQLFEGERQDEFLRAAARCGLWASVGMLRAAMYPEPPPGGMFEEPTEILQAPVVELSLIIPDIEQGKLPANPAAIAGIEFEERAMCENCRSEEQNTVQTQSSDVDQLRQEVAALQQRLKEAEAQRSALESAVRAMRREDTMRRMLGMGVPQSIADELIDIYDIMPEGSQEKIMDVVGRLVSHLRMGNHPPKRDEADQRAMLKRQVFNTEDYQTQQQSELTQQDLDWLKRRFTQTK